MALKQILKTKRLKESLRAWHDFSEGRQRRRNVKRDHFRNENDPFLKWMREPDLNQRPSGYEPDELT